MLLRNTTKQSQLLVSYATCVHMLRHPSLVVNSTYIDFSHETPPGLSLHSALENMCAAGENYMYIEIAIPEGMGILCRGTGNALR